MSPTVVGLDEQSVLEIDVPRWSALAASTLIDEGVLTGELNLLFVDAAAMTELNRVHMGEDRPTDVLSFPLDEVGAIAGDDVVAEPALGDDARLLGDVVVCPEVAAQQARDREIEVDAEIALLVVHGVLHVLGHDHAEPDEKAIMQAREQAALTAHFRT